MALIKVHSAKERNELVDVLTSLASSTTRPATQRFLEGLSGDELRYIVDFLGAGLLDPVLRECGPDRHSTARGIERFQARSESVPAGPDAAHKMILLLEFLTLCRRSPAGESWPAASGCA